MIAAVVQEKKLYFFAIMKNALSMNHNFFTAKSVLIMIGITIFQLELTYIVKSRTKFGED